MRLFAAVHSLVHDGPKPPKALAAEAEIGYGYLMRAADENQPDVQLQARWIAPLTIASGNDIVINQIAEECGGVFYRLAAAGKIDAATANSLKEFSEYLAAVADAQADRSVTAVEYYRVKAQAMDAIRAVLSHVDGLRVSAGVHVEGNS